MIPFRLDVTVASNYELGFAKGSNKQETTNKDGQL